MDLEPTLKADAEGWLSEERLSQDEAVQLRSSILGRSRRRTVIRSAVAVLVLASALVAATPAGRGLAAEFVSQASLPGWLVIRTQGGEPAFVTKWVEAGPNIVLGEVGQQTQYGEFSFEYLGAATSDGGTLVFIRIAGGQLEAKRVTEGFRGWVLFDTDGAPHAPLVYIDTESNRMKVWVEGTVAPAFLRVTEEAHSAFISRDSHLLFFGER